MDMDQASEWCNSYVIVPKANDKVGLCLEPARLNKVLIIPIHRGPALNDILPKLSGAKYLTLFDASLDYHCLKLDEPLSYLITFFCSLGRYRYIRLPFGTAQSGYISQKKIDKLFNEMLNVFGTVDDFVLQG